MSQTTNDDVVERLKQLLANSYTLYLKTQNYHWNVRGPMFTTLHTLFEQQYTELALRGSLRYRNRNNSHSCNMQASDAESPASAQY